VYNTFQNAGVSLNKKILIRFESESKDRYNVTKDFK